MFLLVASVALTTYAFSQSIDQTFAPVPIHSVQLRQQSSLAVPAYRKLLPSLASVVIKGQSPGAAVLIDSSGLYLASKMIGVSGEVELNFANGHIGHATVLSQDGCTQMVLLRSDYVPANSVPVSPVGDTPPGTSLLIILGKGAVSARVVSDQRLGLVKPSNRVVPLSEIRLELPESSLGGAPVFTSEGLFVGLLSASLIHTEAQSEAKNGYGTGGGSRGAATFASTYSDQIHIKNPASRMGPADLTVAYLPSPDVIRLVLEGFESSSHIVDHPSLGIFCRDGAGGAQIQEVIPDSAAAHIGLKENDLIRSIGPYDVRGKSDFAKVMFKVRGGDRVSVRFDREGRTIIREVVLGSSSD